MVGRGDRIARSTIGDHSSLYKMNRKRIIMSWILETLKLNPPSEQEAKDFRERVKEQNAQHKRLAEDTTPSDETRREAYTL